MATIIGARIMSGIWFFDANRVAPDLSSTLPFRTKAHICPIVREMHHDNCEDADDDYQSEHRAYNARPVRIPL